jgi:hypothetical protein
MLKRMAVVCQLALAVFAVSCGDGTEAQRRGVGAACTKNEDCTETGQSCLMQFKGGYCGITGCTMDENCPAGSACVTHDDGTNYCFLVCSVKPDCNVSRGIDEEANCSSTAVLLEEPKDRKVCSPPSSGI